MQSHGVGPVHGADQCDASLRMTDQADATQDESPHDDFTDIRLGAQHFAKIGPLDADQAAVRARAARHQNLPVVEQVELTGELALTVHPEDFWLAIIVDIEDLDAAVKYKKKVNAALSALEQHRSLAQSLLYAVVRDSLGGVDTEARESLGFARVRVGRIDLGRGFDSLGKGQRRHRYFSRVSEQGARDIERDLDLREEAIRRSIGYG